MTIHPVKRSRAKQAAKKARHYRNRMARADLYREYQGGAKWQHAGEWHQKLRNLSAGNGG